MYLQIVIPSPLDTRFTYSVPKGMQIEIGLRVVVPFGFREVTGYVVDTMQEIGDVDYAVKEIKRVIDTNPIFGKQEIALAQWIARFYLCSEGEALSTMIPGGRKERDIGIGEALEQEELIPSHLLTGEQQKAVKDILQGPSLLHYLYGVTGSGKSEVFFTIAEHVLQQGKDVIYLVPEITLTHQLMAQIAKRLSKGVAILHSAMTPSQRISVWRRIKRGEIHMVIGARSAVFAPFENLGLIIIDEEHENSYKAGNTPRYHARQVAQHRALQSQALCVMGSATPSLEAWMMMAENKMCKHVLQKRVAGGTPPTIITVGMLAEKRLLSKKLLSEMKSVLQKGRQVILFLNRRGFSYFFHCRSCGYEMTCPQCSVALTYHKEIHMMMCHYCGYRRKPLTICPECNSVDVGYGGFGTEMVEEEVLIHFPEATIARLDTDSAKDKKHVIRTLKEFKEGNIDILLGTQMVAKGLNFPKVDLVGLVLADSGLNIPDFRAQERTFSLIVQVSGRAGRYNSDGKVVVQTFHPENRAIMLATSNNIDAFYAMELQARRETAFPPYTRMVHMVIRGKKKEIVGREIERLYQMVTTMINSLKGCGRTSEEIPEVIGHAPCPLEKVSGNWRFHLLIRGSRPATVLYVATAIYKTFKPHSSTYLELDVDPLQLM